MACFALLLPLLACYCPAVPCCAAFAALLEPTWLPISPTAADLLVLPVLPSSLVAATASADLLLLGCCPAVRLPPCCSCG